MYAEELLASGHPGSGTGECLQRDDEPTFTRPRLKTVRVKGFGCRPSRRRHMHWGRRREASREGTRGTVGHRAWCAHLWRFGRFGSGPGSGGCPQASGVAAAMSRSGASLPWPRWRAGAHRCSVRGLYASFGRVPGWLAQDQRRRRTAGWQRVRAIGFMRCRSGSQPSGPMVGALAKTRARTAQ